MPRFRVLIPELHYNHFDVFADDEEEAKERAEALEGKSIRVEYSHVLEESELLSWEIHKL